jgi:serine/threonine-protein kinase HipA
MNKAKVYVNNQLAGELIEIEPLKNYQFNYGSDYDGAPISLTMPTAQNIYRFNSFPPFFDGLLPEGFQLEALLRKRKIDRNDPFSQLVAVGNDLVGAVRVEATS